MDEQNKSKSSYMGIIIFLVIFAGLSFGITFWLANNNYETSDKTDIPENDENKVTSSGDENVTIEVDKFGIKDLKGYYYTNNLKIIEKKYTEGDMITEYGYTRYPIEVNYVEIDGLKDKNIQDKINKEVKDTAFSLISEGEEIVRINSYVRGNFSNVLSISIYGAYSRVHLNYDLTTGNQIKFEECFTENANIKSTLQNCLYDELTNNDYEYYAYEETAFEAMYKFSKNDFSYYVYDDSIIVSFDLDYELLISIPLEKYYNEIAIFNRFVTDESIFTEEYNLSKKVHYGLNENAEYYYIKDNLLIYLNDFYGAYFETLENYLLNKGELSVKDNTDGLSKEEKTKNETLKALKNKIENLVEYSKNTPDTMHIFGIAIYNQSNMDVFKLECDKNKFYNNMENDLCKQLVKSGSIYYNVGTEEFSDKYSIISFGRSYIDDEGNIDYDNDYCYSGDYYYLGNINSNTKIIETKDIKYYDQIWLNLAYNEIFARYGHDFSSKIFKDAFSASLWYLPTYGKTVSLEELNDIEKQNITILKEEIEKKKKYPEGFFELDETTYTIDLGYDWEKFLFSYSDDENKIGEVYTPSQRKLIYNEYKANTSTITTKAYFKGKYLHILLKGSKEIYQTIEIKKPKILYGDANSDERVTFNDIEVLEHYLQGDEYTTLRYVNKMPETFYYNSDVDLNGIVDEDDVTILQAYVDEKIKELPHSHRYENGKCVCGVEE